MKEIESQLIQTQALKPNSYEFGKTGNRFKIYYETPLDLQEHLNMLKTLKIIQEEKTLIEND